MRRTSRRRVPLGRSARRSVVMPVRLKYDRVLVHGADLSIVQQS
jgi:hypothetical protein